MHVEDLLHRDLAICEEHVDALTWQTRLAQRLGKTLGDSEHMCTGLFGERREIRTVDVGDDVDVAGIDGLNVQKGGHKVILPDKRGLFVAVNDVTEDTAAHIHPPKLALGTRRPRAPASPAGQSTRPLGYRPASAEGVVWPLATRVHADAQAKGFELEDVARRDIGDVDLGAEAIEQPARDLVDVA